MLQITMANVLPAVISAFTAAFLWQNAPTPPQSACRLSRDVVRLADLPEGSGVAASRRTPGVLWAHNDSGDPVIFALTEEGSVIRRIRVTGAKVDDWEDIAVGPCSQGSCLYIGDIGDNNGTRDRITVYRAPEPSPQEASTVPVEVVHAAYPDGAHDAEALFVTSDSDVFIITKGDPGAVALYRFPRPFRPGATAQLERIGAPATGTKVETKDRPTAADASQDGQWIAVRTTHAVVFYRTADLISGRWREAFRTDVTSLREPRGEGITFAQQETVVLVGEGGGFSRPGTFARLACTLNHSRDD